MSILHNLIEQTRRLTKPNIALVWVRIGIFIRWKLLNCKLKKFQQIFKINVNHFSLTFQSSTGRQKRDSRTINKQQIYYHQIKQKLNTVSTDLFFFFFCLTSSTLKTIPTLLFLARLSASKLWSTLKLQLPAAIQS